MKISLIIPSFYPAKVYGGPIFSSYFAAKELVKLENFQIYVSTTNTNLNCKLDVETNKFLKLENGTFIIKTFQNNNLKSLRKIMTSFFKDIQVIKPAASKKKSGEIYLVGVR